MNFIIRLITSRPLMTCLLIGVVIMSVWWLKFQKKLNMKWYWAPIISVAYLIIGTVAMKFWALLEVGFVPEKAADFRLYGAMFLTTPLIFVGAKLTKRDPRLVHDIATVMGMIGLVVGRINCCIAGCCQGIPIVAGSNIRWPLREIEMILLIFFILLFWQRVYKGKTKGYVLPMMMISYGTFRFLAEWVRDEFTGELGIFHLAHIWSLLAIVIGVILYIIIKKYNESLDSRKVNSRWKQKNTAPREVNQ